MVMNSHRNLRAYQFSKALAVAVYDVTRKFPTEERYGLTSQLRRAAVSVCANIAEGCGRPGRAELQRFLGIALASLAEVDALVDLSQSFGFLDDTAAQVIDNKRSAASKATYRLFQNPGRQ